MENLEAESVIGGDNQWTQLLPGTGRNYPES